MENNMKELEVVLENCESIIIPNDCVKEFSENDGEVLLKIVDNGSIKYGFSCYNNTLVHPIHRLNEYRDITRILEKCDDGAVFNHSVQWGDDDFDNDYQINELVDFKTINICISKNKYKEKRLKEINELLCELHQEIEEIEKL